MSDIRTALVEWKTRAGLTAFAHRRVQAIYNKRHIRLGIALMICTTITGSTAFTGVGTEWQPIVSGLTIIFTMSAGVLAGIQTFLDYKSLGEQHKFAAAEWENLRWSIERLLTSIEDKIIMTIDDLSAINETANKLRQQSPTIHNDHWDDAKKIFQQSSIE